MIMRQFGKVLRPFMLLIMLLTVGCAQQMQAVKPDVAPESKGTAELKSITVTADASRIDILSDNPIVYTYYMLDAPPRLVVDLAQTTAGTLSLPIEVNKGNIKRIDVTKHEFGSGVLSRVEVLLVDKVEVIAAFDQQDKNRLILNIPPAASMPVIAVKESVLVEDKSPVATESKSTESSSQMAATPEKSTAIAVSPEKTETKMAVPAEPAVVTPPVKSALKAGDRGLTAIVKNENSIQLEVAGGVESFKAFQLGQPKRLVIDLPMTKSNLADKIIAINSFNLGKARVGDSPGKLRIVFDAVTEVIPPYSVTRNDKGVLIAFGDGQMNTGSGIGYQVSAKKEVTPQIDVPAPAPAVTSSKPVAAKVAATTPPVTKTHTGSVDAVEFTQAEGISRITVKTSGDCNVNQPVKTGKGYSLTLKNCRLPANLQRMLDTGGMNSVIRSIAPISIKGKTPETRIAVNLRGTLPNSMKRDGTTLYWDFTEPPNTAKPAKATATPKLATAAATPPLMSLDNNMTETEREPVRSKADKSMEDAFAMEKVAQPAVGAKSKHYTGRKVTLEFSDADIRKIFQLLAEVSNQNFLISDDVRGTISLKLVNVPWDQALEVILENKGLGMQKEGNIVQIRPKTQMKSLDEEAAAIRLSEEKRLPLTTVIFDVNFAEVEDIKNQFEKLRSRRTDSSISVDKRTNKIIVVDIDPNVKQMRSLLESLDVPEKQVMIEARIVEASTNFARDIGVQWNFDYKDGSASVANINSINSSMGGVVSSVLPTATTGGIATGVAFGKLLSNIQIDMRLSAAATIGQVKIVSTPKVMTVNNKAAKISQGQMIPYQNTSSTDGAKTEFIEAALSLEVTPHITADGSVSMKIKASNNTAGVGSPPPINKKEATTELVVKNGETTVIGGIYVDNDTEGETGVPYLSEIPLLGWLFKSNSKNKTKNELLIFITPKIVS